MGTPNPENPVNPVEALLSIGLEPGDHITSTEFGQELLVLGEDPPPSGTYICGCPWRGHFIPHFCPAHPGAWPIFEIREPRQ